MRSRKIIITSVERGFYLPQNSTIPGYSMNVATLRPVSICIRCSATRCPWAAGEGAGQRSSDGEGCGRRRRRPRPLRQRQTWCMRPRVARSVVTPPSLFRPARPKRAGRGEAGRGDKLRLPEPIDCFWPASQVPNGPWTMGPLLLTRGRSTGDSRPGYDRRAARRRM